MRAPATSRTRSACVALVLGMMTSPAPAAPFCLGNQTIPPQCIYYDASQCQADAARQGGVCSANAAQLTLQPGIGQYCVVSSDGASACIYPDRQTCMTEAVREHGACAEAPTIAPGKAPDPYAAVGGL